MTQRIRQPRAPRARLGVASATFRGAFAHAVAVSVLALVLAVPAFAHDGETHDATRAHQNADVPVYDAGERSALARSLDSAKRSQGDAAAAVDLQSLLRTGLTAFSITAPEAVGEWSSPVDPAEPSGSPGGIATPYDSADLQPGAHPAYPDGVDPDGDLWAQEVMWGAFPKVVPVFIAQLPNGKVLYWDWKKSGSPGADDGWPESTRAVLWDPATGVATRSDPPFPANVFCAGYSHLPNGDLLLAGGNVTYNQRGIKQTFIYHWATDTWSQGPDMSRARWYPSVAALAAGDSLVLGGDPQMGVPGDALYEPDPAFPEVYTSAFGAGGAYTGGALRPLSNLPWSTDPATRNPVAPRSHRVYPYLAPALDGRVLYAGPDQEMFMVDTEGAGGSEIFISRDSTYREYGSFAYVDKGRVLVGGGGQNAEYIKGPGPSYILPTPGAARDHGAVATTSLIDLLRDGGSESSDPAQGLPESAASGAMATPRRMHNMTVLPDGAVIATGGMSDTDADPADCTALSCPNPVDQNYNNQLFNPHDATKTAELWNPATGSWSSLSPAAKVRQYHSVAMLMEDGRVLTGGGGICGACTQQNYFEPNFEIFTPPYLFKREADFPGHAPGALAPRPKITGPLAGGMLAPVGYGQQFTVEYSTDDGAGNGASTEIDTDTGSAVLMKLAAPTHGVDQGQRRVPLQIVSASAGSLTLAAPPNAYEAPPGYYMLFLVDGRGVPSKAVNVQIGAQLALANTHAAVTVHGGPSLSGGSQKLGLGVFRAAEGNLADVGNDAIRSVEVHPGFKATFCAGSGGTGCAIVAAGEYPALGTAFDQKISYVKVEPADGATTDPVFTAIEPTGPTGPTGSTGSTGEAGPTAPAPPADPPLKRPAPTVTLARTLRLAPKIRARFSCASTCAAKLRITGGRKAITLTARGSRAGKIALDGAGRITITISPAQRRALKADLRKRKRITLTITLTDADGQSATAVARLR